MNLKFFLKYEHVATAMVLGSILSPAVVIYIFWGVSSAILWVVNMSVFSFSMLAFWMTLFVFTRLVKIALRKLGAWLENRRG